ncbi:hypothetical protein CSUI_003340, partial [Cystoisospora suis]
MSPRPPKAAFRGSGTEGAGGGGGHEVNTPSARISDISTASTAQGRLPQLPQPEQIQRFLLLQRIQQQLQTAQSGPSPSQASRPSSSQQVSSQLSALVSPGLQSQLRGLHCPQQQSAEVGEIPPQLRRIGLHQSAGPQQDGSGLFQSPQGMNRRGSPQVEGAQVRGLHTLLLRGQQLQAQTLQASLQGVRIGGDLQQHQQMRGLHKNTENELREMTQNLPTQQQQRPLQGHDLGKTQHAQLQSAVQSSVGMDSGGVTGSGQPVRQGPSSQTLSQQLQADMLRQQMLQNPSMLSLMLARVSGTHAGGASTATGPKLSPPTKPQSPVRSSDVLPSQTGGGSLKPQALSGGGDATQGLPGGTLPRGGIDLRPSATLPVASTAITGGANWRREERSAVKGGDTSAALLSALVPSRRTSRSIQPVSAVSSGGGTPLTNGPAVGSQSAADVRPNCTVNGGPAVNASGIFETAGDSAQKTPLSRVHDKTKEAFDESARSRQEALVRFLRANTPSPSNTDAGVSQRSPDINPLLASLAAAGLAGNLQRGNAESISASLGRHTSLQQPGTAPSRVPGTSISTRKPGHDGSGTPVAGHEGLSPHVGGGVGAGLLAGMTRQQQALFLQFREQQIQQLRLQLQKSKSMLLGQVSQEDARELRLPLGSKESTIPAKVGEARVSGPALLKDQPQTAAGSQATASARAKVVDAAQKLASQFPLSLSHSSSSLLPSSPSSSSPRTPVGASSAGSSTSVSPRHAQLGPQPAAPSQDVSVTEALQALLGGKLPVQVLPSSSPDKVSGPAAPPVLSLLPGGPSMRPGSLHTSVTVPVTPVSLGPICDSRTSRSDLVSVSAGLSPTSNNLPGVTTQTGSAAPVSGSKPSSGSPSLEMAKPVASSTVEAAAEGDENVPPVIEELANAKPAVVARAPSGDEGSACGAEATPVQSVQPAAAAAPCASLNGAEKDIADNLDDEANAERPIRECADEEQEDLFQGCSVCGQTVESPSNPLIACRFCKVLAHVCCLPVSLAARKKTVFRPKERSPGRGRASRASVSQESNGALGQVATDTEDENGNRTAETTGKKAEDAGGGACYIFCGGNGSEVALRVPGDTRVLRSLSASDMQRRRERFGELRKLISFECSSCRHFQLLRKTRLPDSHPVGSDIAATAREPAPLRLFPEVSGKRRSVSCPVAAPSSDAGRAEGPAGLQKLSTVGSGKGLICLLCGRGSGVFQFAGEERARVHSCCAIFTAAQLPRDPYCALLQQGSMRSKNFRRGQQVPKAIMGRAKNPDKDGSSTSQSEHGAIQMPRPGDVKMEGESSEPRAEDGAGTAGQAVGGVQHQPGLPREGCRCDTSAEQEAEQSGEETEDTRRPLHLRSATDACKSCSSSGGIDKTPLSFRVSELLFLASMNWWVCCFCSHTGTTRASPIVTSSHSRLSSPREYNPRRRQELPSPPPEGQRSRSGSASRPSRVKSPSGADSGPTSSSGRGESGQRSNVDADLRNRQWPADNDAARVTSPENAAPLSAPACPRGVPLACAFPGCTRRAHASCARDRGGRLVQELLVLRSFKGKKRFVRRTLRERERGPANRHELLSPREARPFIYPFAGPGLSRLAKRSRIAAPPLRAFGGRKELDQSTAVSGDNQRAVPREDCASADSASKILCRRCVESRLDKRKVGETVSWNERDQSGRAIGPLWRARLWGARPWRAVFCDQHADPASISTARRAAARTLTRELILSIRRQNRQEREQSKRASDAQAALEAATHQESSTVKSAKTEPGKAADALLRDSTSVGPTTPMQGYPSVPAGSFDCGSAVDAASLHVKQEDSVSGGLSQGNAGMPCPDRGSGPGTESLITKQGLNCVDGHFQSCASDSFARGKHKLCGTDMDAGGLLWPKGEQAAGPVSTSNGNSGLWATAPRSAAPTSGTPLLHFTGEGEQKRGGGTLGFPFPSLPSPPPSPCTMPASSLITPDVAAHTSSSPRLASTPGTPDAGAATNTNVHAAATRGTTLQWSRFDSRFKRIPLGPFARQMLRLLPPSEHLKAVCEAAQLHDVLLDGSDTRTYSYGFETSRPTIPVSGCTVVPRVAAKTLVADDAGVATPARRGALLERVQDFGQQAKLQDGPPQGVCAGSGVPAGRDSSPGLRAAPTSESRDHAAAGAEEQVVSHTPLGTSAASPSRQALTACPGSSISLPRAVEVPPSLRTQLQLDGNAPTPGDTVFFLRRLLPLYLKACRSRGSFQIWNSSQGSNAGASSARRSTEGSDTRSPLSSPPCSPLARGESGAGDASKQSCLRKEASEGDAEQAETEATVKPLRSSKRQSAGGGRGGVLKGIGHAPIVAAEENGKASGCPASKSGTEPLAPQAPEGSSAAKRRSRKRLRKDTAQRSGARVKPTDSASGDVSGTANSKRRRGPAAAEAEGYSHEKGDSGGAVATTSVAEPGEKPLVDKKEVSFSAETERDNALFVGLLDFGMPQTYATLKLERVSPAAAALQRAEERKMLEQYKGGWPLTNSGENEAKGAAPATVAGMPSGWLAQSQHQLALTLYEDLLQQEEAAEKAAEASHENDPPEGYSETLTDSCLLTASLDDTVILDSYQATFLKLRAPALLMQNSSHATVEDPFALSSSVASSDFVEHDPTRLSSSILLPNEYPRCVISAPALARVSKAAAAASPVLLVDFSNGRSTVELMSQQRSEEGKDGEAQPALSDSSREETAAGHSMRSEVPASHPTNDAKPQARQDTDCRPEHLATVPSSGAATPGGLAASSPLSPSFSPSPPLSAAFASFAVAVSKTTSAPLGFPDAAGSRTETSGGALFSVGPNSFLLPDVAVAAAFAASAVLARLPEAGFGFSTEQSEFFSRLAVKAQQLAFLAAASADKGHEDVVSSNYAASFAGAALLLRQLDRCKGQLLDRTEDELLLQPASLAERPEVQQRLLRRYFTHSRWEELVVSFCRGHRDYCGERCQGTCCERCCHKRTADHHAELVQSESAGICGCDKAACAPSSFPVELAASQAGAGRSGAPVAASTPQASQATGGRSESP